MPTAVIPAAMFLIYNIRMQMWAEPMPAYTYGMPPSTVPASPMVVISFPERPPVLNDRLYMIISIPVDARFAFTAQAAVRRRRRHLLSSGSETYNPTGTTFQDVSTYIYDDRSGLWVPLEKQMLSSNSHSAKVAVYASQITTNDYTIRISVFGTPSTQPSNSGMMLPPSFSTDKEGVIFFDPDVPSSSKLPTSTTATTLPDTTATNPHSTTTTPTVAETPQPTTSTGISEDLIYIIAGSVGGFLLLVICIALCRTSSSSNDDDDEGDEYETVGLMMTAKAANTTNSTMVMRDAFINKIPVNTLSARNKARRMDKKIS
jgi:hypothetical protein